MHEQLNVENSAIHLIHFHDAFFSAKKPIVWTDKHNETFVGEMYLHEPWKYKKGSKKRGNVWDMISESLNSYNHSKFSVCLKSVRDHYNHLEKEQKRKIREEEKASGIAPEYSAFDDSMEDIIERFKARDEEDQRQIADNKKQGDADAAVTADMRKASMETVYKDCCCCCCCCFANQKTEGLTRCERKQEAVADSNLELRGRGGS